MLRLELTLTSTFQSVSLAYVACLLGYVMMATSVPIINQIFGKSIVIYSL